MSDMTTFAPRSTSNIASNKYINRTNATVIRSHHVDNGATVGLAGNFFRKTGSLKVGVRMSHIREVVLTFGGS